MKTATLIKTVDKRLPHQGQAAFYRLSEPIPVPTFRYRDRESWSVVYISTANVFGALETFAFLADDDCKVLSWTELPASIKGEATHEDVLRNLGYELVT